jgi:hypothetical protein
MMKKGLDLGMPMKPKGGKHVTNGNTAYAKNDLKQAESYIRGAIRKVFRTRK